MGWGGSAPKGAASRLREPDADVTDDCVIGSATA